MYCTAKRREGYCQLRSRLYKFNEMSALWTFAGKECRQVAACVMRFGVLLVIRVTKCEAQFFLKIKYNVATTNQPTNNVMDPWGYSRSSVGN